MDAVQHRVSQDAYSQLVAAICEPRFAAVMLDVVSRLVPVDHVSVMRLLGGSVSQVFANSTISSEPGASLAAVRYIDRYYRFDPNLRLVTDAPRLRGKVMMREQQPAQIENRGYRDVYHETGIVHRVSMLTATGGGLIALNFYRSRSLGKFSDLDFDRLTAASMPLTTLARRHVELLVSMTSSAAAWRQRLKVICHELSPRELEVAARMLAGETLRDIGVALALAHSSVVTYRERAYHRLGVRNLKELRQQF